MPAMIFFISFAAFDMRGAAPRVIADAAMTPCRHHAAADAAYLLRLLSLLRDTRRCYAR